MRKLIDFCDYFVICSGNTDRHAKAIADGIAEGLDEIGEKLRSREGDRDARWIILDTVDVVVHVFEKLTRDFYGLEYLWQEATQVKV